MKSFIQHLIALSLLFTFMQLQAQSNLNKNGSTHTINHNGSVNRFGSDQNYVIPNNLGSMDHIKFVLKGGDGGYRRVKNECRVKGGEGATVRARFKVGYGPNELRPGGEIRFVVGKKGEGVTSNGIKAGGGAGGSAVLYRSPNATGSVCNVSINGNYYNTASSSLSDSADCWVILAVAGGGGGAYTSGVCGGTRGKGGNNGTSGTSGRGLAARGGGNNGNPGGGSAGGAGIIGISGGAQGGGTDGGDGGSGSQKGGFGYGGGGGTGSDAGGGGGYSGGGQGGGGGGSFYNSAATWGDKTSGGAKYNTDHGFITYKFEDRDPAAPDAICETVEPLLDASGQATLFASDVAINSTDPQGGSLSFNFPDFAGNPSSIALDCSDIGTHTIEVEVSNGVGAATCTAIYTMEDDTPPVARCKDIQMYLDANGEVNLVPSDVDNGSSDICNGFNLTYELDIDKLYCPGILSNVTPVMLTVNDTSDNFSSCLANVTVLDTLAPQVTCKNITVNLFGGVAVVSPQSIIAQHTDNCGNSQIISSGFSFNCNDFGQHQASVTVKEGLGSLTASCTATITVENAAPTARCQPLTISLNSNGSYYVNASDIDNGSNDDCGIDTMIVNPRRFNCNHVNGYRNVNLQVTDIHGLRSNCLTTVYTEDTTDPTIQCPANIVQSNDPGNCGAIVAYAVTFNDNCSSPTLLQTDNSGLTSGSAFPTGVTTQSYQVTDAGGNTVSCSFTIEIQDNEAPGINCPPNLNLTTDLGSCQKATVIAYSTNDNCPANFPNSYGNKIMPVIFQVGTSTHPLSVTDASGNTASCSFQVTVVDAEFPSLSCPGNISVANDPERCDAIVNYAINSSDNCSFTQSQTDGSNLTSGDRFPIGTTLQSYSVTDASGNSLSCSFTVEVNDTEAPQITCPVVPVLPMDPGSCGTELTYTIGRSDNCSISLQQTDGSGLTSGDVFPLGSTTQSYSVTDAGGNTASCSFQVTIVDNEDPVISCPASIHLPNLRGQCGRIVTYLIPSGQDNCNSTTDQIAGLASGSTFPVGTTTQTFRVTDASGNTSTCSFDISIVDNEAPSITIAGANPLFLCEGAIYDEVGATAIDNCDPLVNQHIQINSSAVNSSLAGTYPVTYTVTDIHGNSAQAIRTVIVKHTPAQLAPQNCGSCNQIRFDFCEGESAPDLETLLTANANYEQGADFLWYADNSNSQGTSISTPVPNMANKNTHFYWVSQILDGCESVSRRVRVRVRKTSLVQLDLPAIGCGAGQINLAAWVSDSRNIASGFTFYDNDPALGALPVGTVSASNGQVNSGQSVVVSLPPNPITYYAVASNNTGCQVTGSDEVMASAGASLDSVVNITASPGDLIHVNFSSPNATQILWFNHSSFNNPYIGLFGSMGIGTLSFTAQNFGSSPQTAMLRAIAYSGNCAGQIRDFTITVLPGTQNRQTRNTLRLTASRINAHDVKVEWQIQYEFELTSIEIEKQKNNGEWEVIDNHNVDPLDGSYLDHSGMGNVTKYRLKLIHTDGRAIWSQEVEVNFDFYDNKRFTLYPNPSAGRFTLRAAGPLEGEWRYKLSDHLGRTILIGKLEGSETAFDISGLPAAHYFLLLTSPEGKQYLQRVVKN